MLQIIRYTLGIAVITWLAYYLYNNWELFKLTQEISYRHLTNLIIGIIATWVVNSAQTYCLLKAQGANVGAIENLVVQTMTILGNYLPMRMGTLVRFRYFKKVHGIEYSRFGGIVSLRALFMVFVSGLLGIFSLSFWYGFSGMETWLAYLFFSMMFILPLLVYYYRPTIGFKQAPLAKLFEQFSQAFTTITNNHNLSILIIFLLLIQFMILAVRLYISFDAMGQTIPLSATLVLAPTATLLSFITITPGNLGLREWVIGVLSVVLGYNFEVALFAGMIDRAVLVICTFLFGSFSSIYVWKKLRKYTI